MVVLSQRPCLPTSNVTLLAEGGEDEASAEEESAAAESFLSVAFCTVRFVGPVVDGARPGLLHVHLFALLFETRCPSETPVLPLLLLGLNRRYLGSHRRRKDAPAQIRRVEDVRGEAHQRRYLRKCQLRLGELRADGKDRRRPLLLLRGRNGLGGSACPAERLEWRRMRLSQRDGVSSKTGVGSIQRGPPELVGLVLGRSRVLRAL